MNGGEHGRRSACLGIALLLCLFSANPAQAARLLLVQSDDSPPYVATALALKQALSSGWDVHTTTLAELPDTGIDLAVAVGSPACGKLHGGLPDTPLLCLLTPKALHDQLMTQPLSSAVRSAIYIDQPDERQLRVARQLFPKLRRFALLHHDEHPPPLIPGQRQGRIELRTIPVSSEANLVRELRSNLPSVDALLAVPDKRIYNRDTLRSILLTTYRARKPLIGYAKPFVKAGALMSLYSSPAAIGTQAGAWLNDYLSGAGALPPPSYPNSYAIAINSNIATALQLPIDASRYEGRLFDAGETVP